MRTRLLFAALAALGMLVAQSRYQGPRPPKPDVPYLLHGTTLTPADVMEAKEEKRKDGSAYVTAGASAKARTPLAEPIFLFEAKELEPERIQLYKLDVKDGNREVFFFSNAKKKKDSARPLRLLVNRVAQGLSRLEVNETLEPGEYALTPEGSNTVFLFSVY